MCRQKVAIFSGTVSTSPYGILLKREPRSTELLLESAVAPLYRNSS